MAILEWDELEDRVYETGLDRGVLYLPDGSAVPWNGLTSVIEAFDKEVSAVYYDGMKINDLVSLGSFAATMRAITYPEEFVELEGFGEITNGVFAADQMPQLFGLCYRTQIGNAVEGDSAGYKIHLLYNVLAIPNQKEYQTISNETEPTEFEWSLTAIPEEVPGMRPTAHYVIDSREIDPWLLEELEEFIYGSNAAIFQGDTFERTDRNLHGDNEWSSSEVWEIVDGKAVLTEDTDGDNAYVIHDGDITGEWEIQGIVPNPMPTASVGVQTYIAGVSKFVSDDHRIIWGVQLTWGPDGTTWTAGNVFVIATSSAGTSMAITDTLATEIEPGDTVTVVFSMEENGDVTLTINAEEFTGSLDTEVVGALSSIKTGLYSVSDPDGATVASEPTPIEYFLAPGFSPGTTAALLPIHDLTAYISSWYRIKIIDNGDGTWTAISQRDGLITMLTEDTFEIVQANATYLDADTFVISDTTNIFDVT